MQLEGLAVVDLGPGQPGSGLSLVGDLALVQRQPVAHRGRDARYNAPVFDSGSVFADAYDFPAVVKEYHARNRERRF